MVRLPRGKEFGLSLDIGTTEIKGSLLELYSGKEAASISVPNEQKAFGSDVITRLHFAEQKGGIEELKKRVTSAVNKLIARLAEKASIDFHNIKKIAAVGNSAMYHLMLGIDPGMLARAPFSPAEKKIQKRKAVELGISAAEDAVFIFLPNISGFIGSDILASILKTGIYRDKRYNFIMDMGTNGEIALGSKDRIFVASCASGPAFEGRHIACGMPAVDGAIIGVKAGKKTLSLETVGGISPKGISGSGLIDLVSILLDKSVISKNGRMKQEKVTVYRAKREKIFISQKDVREIQLAKAALASGIELLRRRAKITFKDINNFYITGAFGIGINKKSAKNIGLIPKEIPSNKIRFLKDGALAGAKKYLLEPSCEEEIANILKRCVHVELHKDKEFEEAFTASMDF